MGVFATKSFGAFIAAAVLCTSAAAGDLPLARTGVLTGYVLDPLGEPQMGASVQLFNSFGKLVARTASTEDGRFAFANLPANLYSIRVTFADYLPATRDRISILSGVNSLLQIHLASLISSVELQYRLPTAAMSDDWKWVLRTSPATRPVTRFRPVSSSHSQDSRPRVFSGTHAKFSVAGGDVNIADPDYGRFADVGTGFALSTNLLGNNQIALSGNVAQNTTLSPSAVGLSATYTRPGDGFGSSPEIRMTMEQIGVLNGSNGAAQGMTPNAAAMVRTMEISIYQALDLGGAVRLEYGATGQTVDYFNRSTRASPFARATKDFGRAGQLVLSFADGARPDELRDHQPSAQEDVTESSGDFGEANALARIPELSYRNDRLELQRIVTYEAGYSVRRGRQTFSVSGFSDGVRNGRVDVAGNTSALNGADLMWDGVSAVSIYNIGRYSRTGVLASTDVDLTKWLQLTAGAGRMGALMADGAGGGQLAGLLTGRNQPIATAAVRAKLPCTHTKLIANYGWTDSSAIIPQHLFTTQDAYYSPGLNVSLRQPLPQLFGMPGKIELRADLRNLLAQGYIPIGGGNQTLLLVQTPRAVRGGVNFTF